ncbi:MAG TPA: response regulator transcription factor [Candidatus Sulfomarinibacteraceae bacterium]|nr:response regulator transcription factor [Candidatus Sulfomarinibacteraceae bacterium]
MNHGNGRAPCILVVDDSPETLQIVRQTLQKSDFTVRTAISGEQALKLVSTTGLPHLAIVDINMPPGMTGIEFAEQLYEFSDVPVIMLTAVDEVKMVVKAIQEVAEDYVLKPFLPGELVARVRRVLERVGRFPFAATSPVPVDRHLSVDFPARRIITEDGDYSLTPTEARLLYILMRNAGETVNTDFILRRMWPRELTYEDRLHVFVHRLRAKLKEVGEKHQYVVSERGIGYRFQPQSENNEDDGDVLK